MTINSQQRTAGPFNGTGSVFAFPFFFKVFQTSDVRVVQTNAIGAQFDLLLDSDYVISLGTDQNVNPGGTVVLANALPAGYTLVITSRVNIAQPASITNFGGFYPKVIEDALDRLTILLQQSNVTLGRALRVPEVGGAAEIPVVATRKNRVLAFDDTGRPVAIVGVDSGSAAALSLALIGSFGATLVTLTQAGTGAVPRTLADKFKESVSVEDYGAVGDLSQDDTPAFRRAIVALGPKGGIVYYHGKHLLDTVLVVPRNVTICGPFRTASLLNNTSHNYTLLAHLAVNPAAGITVTGAGGVHFKRVLCLRKNMTFPEFGDSLFAGLCVSVIGSDDVSISESQFIGFAKAGNFQDCSRVRLWHNYGDCSNGFWIYNSVDTSYVDTNHFWPFASVAAVNDAADFNRSGTAFRVEGCDWTHFTNCFSYGYFRHFQSHSANETQFLNCNIDGTTKFVGSIGYFITGSSLRSHILGGHVSSQDLNFYYDTSIAPAPFGEHFITDVVSSTSVQAGGVLFSGQVRWRGGNIVVSPVAWRVASTTAVLDIDDVTVLGIAPNASVAYAIPFNFDVGVNRNCIIGPGVRCLDWVGGDIVTAGNYSFPSMAAAATLAIPPYGETFQITGAFSTITKATGCRAGRIITLHFTGNCGLNDGSGGGGFSIGGAKSSFNGATLVLQGNSLGTTWFQVGGRI